MKKIILLILLFSNFAYPQNQDGGSVYSRFGLGLMNYSTSVRSSGLAGTNLALFDLNELNSSNPATWSMLKYSNFSAGAFYENLSLQNDKSSNNFQQFNFNNSIVGIPLDKENNMVLGLGIEPYSRVVYSISENQTSSTVNSTLLYHGSGGVSEALFGLTYSPVSDLYLGLKGSFLFGNIRKYVKVSYSNTSYFSNELTEYLISNGMTFTGGAIYSGLSKYLKLPSFNVAFVFSPAINIKGRKEVSSIYYLSQESTTVDTTLIDNGNLGIPGILGFGLSVGINDKISLSADMVFQDWSSFQILDKKSDQIKNSLRFSFGAELLPDKDVLSGLFNRTAYRFGLYYSELNYKINNTNINEYGASIGISQPLSKSSLLNSSLTYGVRGTKDNGLILDKFFRLQFSLTIGELWFVNPEEP